MSTERSDEVYAHWVEASQKFDYFVAGVSLALVGYLGQAFHPIELGWNSSTVELVSIIVLLASSVAGLKRIESNVRLLMVSHQWLYQQEMAGNKADASLIGKSVMNKATGEVFSAPQLARQAHRHQAIVEVVQEEIDRIKRTSNRWYHARNVALLLGLGLLLLSRVLPAFALSFN